jgi:diguanylate cyclase (GGDEF)-like protein
VIQLDPVVSARILRVANSPIYGMTRSVDNLTQAITLLGVNETTALALGVSIIESLRDRSPGGLKLPDYWRRSLATATGARAIAKTLKLPSADRYFLAGLLQDLGMLIIDVAFPDVYRRPDADPQDHHAITRIEHSVLGADHTRIGACQLQRWNLPEPFLYAAYCSHAPDAYRVPSEYQPLVNAVYVAALVADVWWRSDWDVQISLATSEANRLFAIDPPRFAELLATDTSMLKEAAPAFDVPLGDATSLDATLAKATELVSNRTLASMQQVAELRACSKTLADNTRQLEAITRRDKITGLCNRTYFDKVLAADYDKAVATGAPLSVAFAVLDGLRAINDSGGHPAGDDVIRQFAAILNDVADAGKTVARYGDNEFVIALPDTSPGAAQRIGAQLVAAVNKLSISGTRVGISVGIATCDASRRFESSRALLAAADAAIAVAEAKGGKTVIDFGAVPAQAAGAARC